MVHTYKIEKLESKTGHTVLKINGYFLNSKYNPITEAEKLAKVQYIMHHTHIVFGYGSGYIVDALFEQLKHGEKIIIIDPLIEQEVITIDERHNKEPFYYWGLNDVNTLAFTISQLTTSKQTKINVIVSNNYNKLFPQELKSTLKMIKDYQEKSLINENTIIMFAEKWQDNLAENTVSIVNDYNLEMIHGKYSKPVVIASGGPSLTKQLPLLKKIREKVLVIAAGSTINSLLAANIEPDFVVSVDGGEANYHHFKDLKLKNARLIYSPFNHPQIRNSFEKTAIAFATNIEDSTISYFKRKFNRHLSKIIGGGTVAHFSLSIAQYISNSPIAMIGQDLAYTDNKTHASNNKYEKKISEKDIAQGNVIEAEGYFGDTVLTSKVLYSMKITFEEMARFYQSKVPVYNCTEGGLKINGYEQIPFQKFCEKYVSVQNMQEEFSMEFLTYDKIEKSTFIKIFEEELTIYDKTIDYLSEALSILKKNNSKVDFNKNTLKKLDKIDKELIELYPNVQMQFIVTPIILEIEQSFLEKENETIIDRYERVYGQSNTLYSKLLKAAKGSKKRTQEIIIKLNKEEI